MTIIATLSDGLKGLWSLVVGMDITGRTAFKPQITVHYPRQTVDNLSTFRGHIELIGLDDDPATPRCISCMMCANVCPSQCIAITKAAPAPKAKPAGVAQAAGADDKSLAEAQAAANKPAKAKSKAPAGFVLDYNLCSLCGLCVQNCPVDSLGFSKDVYSAGFSRGEFVYDLMARLAQRVKTGEAAGNAYRPGTGLDVHLPRLSTDEQRGERTPTTAAVTDGPGAGQSQ